MNTSLTSQGRPLHSGHRTASAFTLVELLVVITIIAVLVAIIFPVFGKVKESGNRTKCLSNVRQIGAALRNYATDNNQKFPYIYDGQQTWDNVLITQNYLTKQVFNCPSDIAVRTVAGDKRSYAYNGYIGDLYDNPLSIQGAPMKITNGLSSLVLVADRGAGVAVINSPACANAYCSNDCLDNHKLGANYVFMDLHAAFIADTGNFGQAEGSDSTKLFQKYWLPQ